MAVNSALRKFGKPPRIHRSREPEPLAVGEVDANVFNCPRCARPLAHGTNQCPGCGTVLLLGVRARVALGFLVVGVMIGTIVGGGAMLAVGGSPSRVVDTDGTAVLPAKGGTTAGASAEPLLPADLGIPSQAVSSLRQATVINGRLTGYAAELDRALAARSTKGIDIARILRSMSSDVMFGLAVAPTIAPWPDAAGLSADLEAFYAKVRDTAQTSLKASVSDTAAYKLAAKRMGKLLAALPSLDARATEIVDAAGLAPLAP